MASINLSEFIKVEFVDVARVLMGAPIYFAPTLVFRDDMDRAIAIPIGPTEYTLFTEIREGLVGAHTFILSILNTLGAQVECAIIHDICGTGTHDLTFLGKLLVRFKDSSETREVEGKAGDVLSLAMATKAPIYVKKDIIELGSTKYPVTREEEGSAPLH